MLRFVVLNIFVLLNMFKSSHLKKGHTEVCNIQIYFVYLRTPSFSWDNLHLPDSLENTYTQKDSQSKFRLCIKTDKTFEPASNALAIPPCKSVSKIRESVFTQPRESRSLSKNLILISLNTPELNHVNS